MTIKLSLYILTILIVISIYGAIDPSVLINARCIDRSHIWSRSIDIIIRVCLFNTCADQATQIIKQASWTKGPIISN